MSKLDALIEKYQHKSICAAHGDYTECFSEYEFEAWKLITKTFEEMLNDLQKLKEDKIEPDFIWPEHLPDGTRVWPEGIKLLPPINFYIGVPGQGTCNLKDYNALARPEDRIEIPEWLEKKPRTIVKGES